MLCFGLLYGGPAMAENGSPARDPGKDLPIYSEAEVKARFKAMPSIISKRYNEETRRRIRSYVYGRRAFAEDLLGRGAVYFPIIEQYLKQYDLPLELRVLPIIETNFDPLAVSRAGASGLWQFMQGTAEHMGLNTSEELDERFDIHRSTEAAVQYLARLYEKYQDWALALAAYNCGPRYVNRAIKRGKSRDFWTIARYLPRETQKYVPKFLAASYLIHYYHEHQLVPAFPELDLQLTQDLRLPRPICLEDLARIAGTPLEVLLKLNPAYADGCVPQDPRGALVTVPKRSADFVLGYLSMPEEGRKYFPQFESGKPAPSTASLDEYLVVYYPPQPEESLADAAALFQIEESLLLLWNGLEPDPVFDGERELLIYIPVRKPFHLPKGQLPKLPIFSGEGLSPLSDDNGMSDIVTLMSEAVRPANYWLHTLGIGESPFEVSRQYNLGNTEVLREHNAQALWTPGEIIRIPRPTELMAEIH